MYVSQDEILSRAMAMTRVVIAQKVEESGGQEQLAGRPEPTPGEALGGGVAREIRVIRGRWITRLRGDRRPAPRPRRLRP